MSKHNDMKLIMESWRDYERKLISEQPAIDFEHSIMGQRTKDSVFKKKPKQKDVCRMMKRIMDAIHTKKFIAPRIKKAKENMKKDPNVLKALKSFFKSSEFDVSEATKIMWRQRLVPLTIEMTDAIVDYAVSGDLDKSLPPKVREYIDENFMNALKVEFFQWLKEFAARQAAIQAAGAATATSTLGLSLTVNAALAIKNLFKSVMCLEDLNDHATRLVGVKGLRMDSLTPDFEKSRKGLENFAKDFFS